MGGAEHFAQGSLLPPPDIDADKSMLPKGGSSDVLTDSDASYDLTDTPSWTKVGQLDSEPVKLSLSGTGDILRLLQKVELTKSVRRSVKGDEVCLGLDEIARAFLHPHTTRNQGLIKLIVEEVRSHEELRNISFTSIRINHNTISAPHTENNLKG